MVNPSSPAFRRKSLGSGKNKDLVTVKFGAGRYRLFFVTVKEKVIILGWMNDENTRTYGKKTDAYTVFSKMLKEDILLPTGKPHPRDRRKPLMVFTMPAERIGVDQRASLSFPTRITSTPALSQSSPDYPQNAFINNDHTLSINDLYVNERLNLLNGDYDDPFRNSAHLTV